jgi:hypothetical protein
MQKIAFGEWLPDQPGVMGSVTEAVNCYPVANGYAPFNSESNLSDPAGADLLVAFSAKLGNVTTIFAGSATNLFKFDAGDLDLDPLTTTGYSTIEYWDVTQYGAKVIAANGADKLQAFELGVSTYFGDLAAAAPEAKYVTVVRDFVVAANTSGEENKVYWSDINDETDWTPGAASQSDTQIIPDGGDITGLAGGEYGLVFLDRAIYRMSYTGSPFFFQFDAISRSLGCMAPGSITQFGGITYFLADDGFYSCNGQSFTNIGEEKINRWFFERVSRQDIRLKVSATVDPIRKLALWCFPLQAGGYGILVYNIPLGKWSYLDTTATSVASALSATVTLEQLDNFSASIDALTVSLDDPQWAGNQLILIGTTGRRIITFGGANKTAYVVSGDINEGRSTVTLAKPIVDGGSAQVAVASRTLLSDQVLFGTAVAANSENRVSLRANGNYHRVKVTPTGDNWKTVVGTDIEITKQGNR